MEHLSQEGLMELSKLSHSRVSLPPDPRGFWEGVSPFLRMGFGVILIFGISASPMADIYYVKEKPKNAPKPLTEEERARQQTGPKRKAHIGPLILKEEPPVEAPPAEDEAAKAISEAQATSHNPPIKGEEALRMANQTLEKQANPLWKRVLPYLLFILAGIAVVLGLKWWAERQLPAPPNPRR